MAASKSSEGGVDLNLSDRELGELRSRIRFKVCYDVGFYCPDVDDIVQETLTRFLVAGRANKIHNPESIGAFVHGICRNVVSEYRRRNLRNAPMPETVPEPAPRGLLEADALELRQAVAHGLDQLADRDRKVLRAFYLEEKPRAEILRNMALTDENFRVILFRAKERFRAIYSGQAKHPGASRH
jgi:RNA polymerase sigma-70 factor (ECF subfamily)